MSATSEALPFETFNAEKKRVEFITLLSLSLPAPVPPAFSSLKKLQFHNVLGYEKNLAKYRRHDTYVEARCAGRDEKEVKKVGPTTAAEAGREAKRRSRRRSRRRQPLTLLH